MPLPVKLSEVVRQLSSVDTEFDVYLNIKTGQFVGLASEFGFEPEDDFEDDSVDENSLDEPEWMKEERRIRREVLESDDYLQLPDKFDIHDWQIMDDFCLSQRRPALEMNCAI